MQLVAYNNYINYTGGIVQDRGCMSIALKVTIGTGFM